MISREEIAKLSLDELSDLLSNVLLVALMKGGEDSRCIPDGFKIDCETDHLKVRFDIDVKTELKDNAYEMFKKIIRQHGTTHIFRPGDL